MSYICPRPLKLGDTIGLVTPSSPMMVGRLEFGIAYLEQKGFKVKIGKHVHDATRFLAGRDEDRAKDIMDFFIDDDVTAIIATGGGYGAVRVLPLLDYNIIRSNPKTVIGFSDTTALHLGLLKQAGIMSLTGFIFSNLDNGTIDPLVERTLTSCLNGDSYEIKEGSIVHEGIAEGALVGGNLGAFVELMGTPWQPDFKNSILLIEDAWAEPCQIDGKLAQLYLAGVYEQVAGVIFGKFENCIANYFPERDGTIEDVISDWSSRLKVPCLKNFPYGHSNRRTVLPIGKNVTLNTKLGILTIS